jgi:hypothetical protein
MNCPKWVPKFLEHRSKSKSLQQRTKEILSEAASNPTDANLLTASLALGNGHFAFTTLRCDRKV